MGQAASQSRALLTVVRSATAVALVSTLLAGLAHAQVQPAILGVVLGDSGRVPIHDVEVIVLDVAGGRRLSARTDIAGFFRIVPVPPGEFRLQARRSGYVTLTTAPYTLDVIRQGRIELVMRQTRPSTRATIRGVVRDSLGKPIAAAEVRVGSLPPRVTDDSGRFRIELAERGEVLVEIRRTGFLPLDLMFRTPADTTISLVMIRLP
jgi:hypothetical protein